MPFTPDIAKIVNAIAEAEISPSAKEQSSELVDAWIAEYGVYDYQYKTIAVEVPWYYWIQPKTVLVGVMDRLFLDADGVVGDEHKSCKEPTKNKDGSDSAWWNEEVWLKSISEGTQVSIYALAMQNATFVLPASSVKFGAGKRKFSVKNPRVMVRAAVKSSPPRMWPTKIEDSVFQYPKEYLEGPVTNALIARAESVRAMRKAGKFPWALPGNHCTNRFRRLCSYYDPFCSIHEHPVSEPTEVFDTSDPGSKALEHAGVSRFKRDPELVIFSASSYDTCQACPEAYRILVGGYAEKEESEALGVGTGLHVGCAEVYRQMMVAQSQSKKALDKKTTKK